MNWYHNLVSVWGRRSPGTGDVFTAGGDTRGAWSWCSCPWQGVEMSFTVPPNAKHPIIPWLSCLRPGVCWRFYTLPRSVTRAEFSRCLFWGLSKLQSECWGFCRADVQFSQWQKLVFVWSERLDFDGVGVSGLILVCNNVKIQPSIPWVPLENVNAFRPQSIWGKAVVQKLSCALQGGPDSVGQSQVVFRAHSLSVSLVSLLNI